MRVYVYISEKKHPEACQFFAAQNGNNSNIARILILAGIKAIEAGRTAIKEITESSSNERVADEFELEPDVPKVKKNTAKKSEPKHVFVTSAPEIKEPEPVTHAIFASSPAIDVPMSELDKANAAIEALNL